MNTRYILAHGDLDGAASVVLIERLNSVADTHIIPCQYSNIDNEIETILKIEDLSNIELFIADICPSKKVLEKIHQSNLAAKILFDHHITKKGHLSKYEWCFFDENECACSLYYKLFCRDIVDDVLDEFVWCVKAHDLWKLDSPYRSRGEDLNRLYQFLGFRRFIKQYKYDLIYDLSPAAVDVIDILKENEDLSVKKTLRTQMSSPNRYIDYRGHKFAIIQSGEYISRIGNDALGSEYGEDLDYVAIVSINNVVSLRSRGDIDVSEIAKRFGGGGHKSAAGFSTNIRNIIEQRISELFMSDP